MDSEAEDPEPDPVLQPAPGACEVSALEGGPGGAPSGRPALQGGKCGDPCTVPDGVMALAHLPWLSQMAAVQHDPQKVEDVLQSYADLGDKTLSGEDEPCPGDLDPDAQALKESIMKGSFDMQKGRALSLWKQAMKDKDFAKRYAARKAKGRKDPCVAC